MYKVYMYKKLMRRRCSSDGPMNTQNVLNSDSIKGENGYTNKNTGSQFSVGPNSAFTTTFTSQVTKL